MGNLQRLADHEAEADLLVREIDALERTIVSIEAEVAEVTGWLDQVEHRRPALLAAPATRVGRRPRSSPFNNRPWRRSSRGVMAHWLATRSSATRLRRPMSSALTPIWLSRLAKTGWRCARPASTAWQPSWPPGSCPASTVRSAAVPSIRQRRRPSPAPSPAPRKTQPAAGQPPQRSPERRAHARLSQLEVALAEARARAGGDELLATLAARAADAGELVATTTAKAEQLPVAEKAVRDFDQEREARVRQQVRLAQQLEQAGVRAGEQRTRLVQLHEVLTAARGDDPSLAARSARLLRLADDCDRLVAQITAAEGLEGAVDAALHRVEVAAAERNLGSLDAVAAAVRDDDRVNERDEFRQRYDAELATVTELLGDPLLADVDEGSDPEIEVLAAAAESAEGAHTQAAAALTGARSRVKALERLLAGVRDLLAVARTAGRRAPHGGRPGQACRRQERRTTG